MSNRHLLAQRLAVQVGRQVQNETLLDLRAPGKAQRNLDHMGNADLDVDIFANTAEYVCKVLGARGTVIFDASEFHLTSPAQAASHDSDTGTKSSGNTKPEAALQAPNSSLPAQSGNSDPTGTSLSLSSEGNESRTSSTKGKTHCSFVPSATPVRILGNYGTSKDHFADMSGEETRPVIANFLSTASSTGLNSRLSVSSRAKNDDGFASFLPENANVCMCTSVAEADAQPAFIILAYFDEEDVVMDEPSALFMEQLGVYLIYSSIRSRVVEVDRAQMRFTQRIQHELKTPLHAIIGIGEIAKQTLSKDFDPKEIAGFMDTITISADSLNMIVEDIVDFSLMERVQGERALAPSGKAKTSWKTLCDEVVSTCLRVFELQQRVCKVSRVPSRDICQPSLTSPELLPDRR